MSNIIMFTASIVKKPEADSSKFKSKYMLYSSMNIIFIQYTFSIDEYARYRKGFYQNQTCQNCKYYGSIF